MSTGAPPISVVVPTRDRPERLSRCLAGMRELTPPTGGFEVVIVDDGSRRPLDEVVRPFRRDLGLTLIRQDNAGPAAARNAGSARAAGALLAFTDDDCVPDPRWLVELFRSHERHPDALIGGRTVNALPGNPFSEASQALVSFLYAYYERKIGYPAFFTSNNMLVPRDRFLALGGFDTSFRLAAGEDRELCDRWVAAGHPLRFEPEALIRHYHRLGLRSYTRQHFNYGRGAYYFHRRRGERAEGVRLEPPSFYRDLVLFPLRGGGGIGTKTVLTGLMGLSQIANAAGYFYERWEAGRRGGATTTPRGGTRGPGRSAP